MNRTVFTLLAMLALLTCLAAAQEQQPPAQSQPGQSQPMPPTQQAPPPQQQPPAGQGQAGAAPAGHGQTGMSSQQLQAAFQRTFQKYPELSNVKVNVADDKIELSGNVPSQADKDKVHRTAEANADGRKVVDDDLKVSGGSENKPATPPPSNPPPQ